MCLVCVDITVACDESVALSLEGLFSSDAKLFTNWQPELFVLCTISQYPRYM